MLTDIQKMYLAENILKISDELRFPGESWRYFFDDDSIENEDDALVAVFAAVNKSTDYQWIFSFLFNLMAEDDEVGYMAADLYNWLAEAIQG